RQVESLPRAAIARASLAEARAIRVCDMVEACEVANLYGPEHLSIQTEEAEKLVERISAAGAVFVGRCAAETLGDYAAGPSHVLPTDGAARTLGGVTTASFMTTMSVQTVSEQGATALAPVAAGCRRRRPRSGSSGAARRVPSSSGAGRRNPGASRRRGPATSCRPTARRGRWAAPPPPAS